MSHNLNLKLIKYIQNEINELSKKSDVLVRKINSIQLTRFSDDCYKAMGSYNMKMEYPDKLRQVEDDNFKKTNLLIEYGKIMAEIEKKYKELIELYQEGTNYE